MSKCRVCKVDKYGKGVMCAKHWMAKVSLKNAMKR